MRPLAIAVVMAGVVLLAFGTWLILRASFARTPVRKPAPRAEPPARREPVPFPPAAAARTGAWTPPPGDDVPVTGRVPSDEGTRTGGATRWTPAAEEAPGGATRPAPSEEEARRWGRPSDPGAEPLPFPAEPGASEPEPVARVEAPSAQVDEPIVQPVEEPIVQPVEEPIVQPVEEPIVQAVEEPVVRPVVEPVVAEEPVVTDVPAAEASGVDDVGPVIHEPGEHDPDAEVEPGELPVAGQAVEQPVTEQPQEPTPVEEPVAEGPVAPEPVTEPVSEQPIPEPVAEPAPEEPAAEPAVAEAAVAEPVAEQTAAVPVVEEAVGDGVERGSVEETTPIAGLPLAEFVAGASPGLTAGAAAWGTLPPVEDPPQEAPRSDFGASLAARPAEDPAPPPPPPPPAVPSGDAVTPMGTVLGGGSGAAPLPSAPPPVVDPLEEWARERRGPEPPHPQPLDEFPSQAGWPADPPPPPERPWVPDLFTTPEPELEQPEAPPRYGATRFDPPPQRDGPPFQERPQERPRQDRPYPGPQQDRPYPGPQQDRPYPGPQQDRPFQDRPPQDRPYQERPQQNRPFQDGPRQDRPFPEGPPQDRAQQDRAQRGRPAAAPPGAPAGPRTRKGRPEDPRQAAVYDALTINEQVLDEVWTSPSVDVLKVVSSIVVNALDAYEDDPAEYADWVAVHRTGNCDCH